MTTDEGTVEQWRIVTKEGHPPPGWSDAVWHAEPEAKTVEREDARFPDLAPHRVQRREVTEWEDA